MQWQEIDQDTALSRPATNLARTALHLISETDPDAYAICFVHRGSVTDGLNLGIGILGYDSDTAVADAMRDVLLILDSIFPTSKGAQNGDSP